MTNTWNAPEGEFATRITLSDLSGFFSKQLTVASGTRALIIDSGTYLGEVPPGTYTLQTFIERLKFWKSPKQVDVILVRQDDVPLQFRIEQIPTIEELLVAVKLGLVVQIQDTAVFARNLLGTRSNLSIEEMRQTVSPIIAQALRESIRQLNIETLCSPEVRPLIATGIQETAQNSLRRYGIECTDIQTAEIFHVKYNELREKIGEIFLLDQSITHERKLHEVLDKETLQKIERREREVELEVLAENVELDRKQSDIALRLRRNEVRKDMRDAVNSDKFDKLQTKEERQAFRREIDKQRLIRDDEWDELERLFEDKQKGRELVARKLKLDRDAELDELSAAIAHAQKVKTFKHEVELTMLSDDEDARRWRQTLEREAEEAEHKYQEKIKGMQRDHEFISKNQPFMRAEDVEELLHKQKLARLEGEFAEEEKMREIRKHRIEDEYDLERKRREHAWKIEQATSEHALTREIKNDEYDREKKRGDDEHARKQERAETRMRQMEMIMQGNAERDRIKANAKVEISRNESQARMELREETAKLQEQRVQDAQKGSAATLETIKEITGQAFAAMGQVAGRSTVPTPGSTDPSVQRVIVCSGCRTENQPPAKFCSNCGREL